MVAHCGYEPNANKCTSAVLLLLLELRKPERWWRLDRESKETATSGQSACAELSAAFVYPQPAPPASCCRLLAVLLCALPCLCSDKKNGSQPIGGLFEHAQTIKGNGTKRIVIRGLIKLYTQRQRYFPCSSIGTTETDHFRKHGRSRRIYTILHFPQHQRIESEVSYRALSSYLSVGRWLFRGASSG
jgi:hypothetical protein